MEQTKLSQIEKKMEMSLDDIIKQNRSRPAASGGAKGSGNASARAPLMMKKGQASKAQPPKAPKSLVKTGIAGKRQAIQQKKVAPKSIAGTRPRTALTGGVNKATSGIKRGAGGGGFGQTMAQKIISRARNVKQQQAPKQLAKTRAGGPKAQMAPKQLAAPKQQRKQIQFSGLNKPLQTARQQPGSKSLAQTMNQRRRGGDMAGGQRGGPVGKQGSARAPIQAGGQRRGGGAAAPMQLNRPMQGGVRKRGGPQARAPLFQNQRQAAGNQRQMGGWPAAQQQMPRRQMQQMQQAAPVQMRRGPMPRGQFAPVGQFRPLQAAANPVLLARQQAVMQAVRLQKLEEERNRAERKAFIHQSMQMMGGPPARSVASRAPIQPAVGRMGSGMGMGGGLAMRGMGGGGAYEQRGYEQRRYSGYA